MVNLRKRKSIMIYGANLNHDRLFIESNIVEITHIDKLLLLDSARTGPVLRDWIKPLFFHD